MSLDFTLKVIGNPGRNENEHDKRQGDCCANPGKKRLTLVVVMMTGRNRQFQKLLQRQNQMDLIKMEGNKDEGKKE